MKTKNLIKYILGIVLITAISLTSLVSCGESETEESTTGTPTTEIKNDFDFGSADMSEYVSLDESAYSNIDVTISDIYKVTDENVKTYIDGILKQYPQPVKITDRPVQKDDTVYIYYEGLLDGVAFSGGTYSEKDGAPYALKIGSGKFIAGFEDGLIGVVPSETSKENPVALNLTFPQNYQSTALAGKDVVFNVYIMYISNETYIPEYNEDTVKNILGFTVEDGKDLITEFEAYIKSLLEEEHDSAVIEEISRLMLEKLTVKKYPQESVDYWFASYSAQIQQYVDYYAAYGMTVTFEEMALQMLGLKEGDDWKAELTEFAQNTVKSKMLYYYIAEANNLTISDAEYNDMVDYFVNYYKNQGYTYTRDEIIKGIGEDAIRENALFDKVDSLLVANSTVSYKAEESSK